MQGENELTENNHSQIRDQISKVWGSVCGTIHLGDARSTIFIVARTLLYIYQLRYKTEVFKLVISANTGFIKDIGY